MNFRYQRGSSIFIVVVILPVLGILLLNSLHYQLDNALLITGDERRYLRAYNQAISSLNWGVARKWDLSRRPYHSLGSKLITGWLCEAQPEQKLTACIKSSTVSGVLLVKGESQIFPGQPKVTIYQRVKPEHQTGWVSGIKNSKMVTIAQGMLDFCPEKDEKSCA